MVFSKKINLNKDAHIHNLTSEEIQSVFEVGYADYERLKQLFHYINFVASEKNLIYAKISAEIVMKIF